MGYYFSLKTKISISEFFLSHDGAIQTYSCTSKQEFHRDPCIFVEKFQW